MESTGVINNLNNEANTSTVEAASKPVEDVVVSKEPTAVTSPDTPDELKAVDKDSLSIMENRNVASEVPENGAEWTNASTFKGASFTSSVINTINTVIGAAIISIANSIRTAGVLGALLMMIIVLIPSLTTIYYMACATVYTNEDIYGAIARKLTHPAIPVIIDIILMFFNLGIDVAYMNIGFNQIVAIGRDVFGQGEFFVNNKTIICLVVSFCLLFPLCCIKTMDALKFTSTISVCCVFLFVITFVCLGFKGFSTRGWDLNLWPKTTSDLSSSLAVFILCICSHINTSKITAEMRHKSGKSKYATKAHKTFWATTVAYVICVLVYFLVGVCGYAAFGEGIQASILDNLEGGFWWYIYIGYSIVVLSSFPILSMPALITFDNFVFTSERTTKRRVIEGLVWTIVCFFIWYKIPSLSTIFGITGNFCGSLLTFVFPSIFFLSMCKREKKKPVEMRSTWFKPKSFEMTAAWSILVLGIVVCIWATSMEVINLMK